jgi:hypothetical protein
MAAPPLLLAGLLLGVRWGWTAVWRDVDYPVGWCAIAIGLVGVVLRFGSRFFHERTIKSLVYAAPFAAPLAYAGMGLLLVMNRMVDRKSKEWPRWVLLLGLGGVVGNFIFSLMDHAQNGFYHKTEWMPVVSSALSVGFLATIYIAPVTRRFLVLCALVLAIQVGVGLLGFALHTRANVHGSSAENRPARTRASLLPVCPTRTGSRRSAVSPEPEGGSDEDSDGYRGTGGGGVGLRRPPRGRGGQGGREAGRRGGRAAPGPAPD